MTPTDRAIVEAILLVAEEPIPAGVIGQVLEKPRIEVEELLTGLAEEYERGGRGFRLRNAAGGWRLYSAAEAAPWLERFVGGHSHPRLSPAALEVLAVIAYRGPIARSQIAEIRGVDSDGVVRTLEQRGLVEGRARGTGPGAPVLFTVSREFLERLGLDSPKELPPLADFMPDAEAVEDMEAKLSPPA